MSTFRSGRPRRAACPSPANRDGNAPRPSGSASAPLQPGGHHACVARRRISRGAVRAKALIRAGVSPWRRAVGLTAARSRHVRHAKILLGSERVVRPAAQREVVERRRTAGLMVASASKRSRRRGLSVYGSTRSSSTNSVGGTSRPAANASTPPRGMTGVQPPASVVQNPAVSG
jgi:hypothetical protein